MWLKFGLSLNAGCHYSTLDRLHEMALAVLVLGPFLLVLGPGLTAAPTRHLQQPHFGLVISCNTYLTYKGPKVKWAKEKYGQDMSNIAFYVKMPQNWQNI